MITHKFKGPGPAAAAARLSLAAGATLLLAGHVRAADQPAPDDATTPQGQAEASVSEVVVTGTRLRHSGPVGSTLIDVDQTQIQQSGANSVADALRTLPQVDNLGVTEGTRAG